MDSESEAERAQSEVIGVVLLVGIVVIAAGFVGIFVLDLAGDDLQKAPQTNFEVEQYGNDTRQVRLYHAGGDVITDTDAITVTVNGANELQNQGVAFENANGNIDSQTSVYFSKNMSGSGIHANASTISDSYPGLDPGTEIRVIWNPDDADNSAILFEHEVEARG